LDQASATLRLRYDPQVPDERAVVAAVQAIVDHLE